VLRKTCQGTFENTCIFSVFVENDELNFRDRPQSEHFMNITVCRHIVSMGEWRDVYRVLVGKPEGKRPLGRPMRRWENNIKMELQDVGCGGMD